MRKKKIYDPYAEILEDFNKRGIRYVVVGMSGINYYASSASEIFSTQDFDIFIKPTTANTGKAILEIKKLGYITKDIKKEVGESDVPDIARSKSTIICVNEYSITVELILAVSGFTFNQMELDANTFVVNNVPIKVGDLKKLLMSKKIAGREKDKLFLKRFEILIKEKKIN